MSMEYQATGAWPCVLFPVQKNNVKQANKYTNTKTNSNNSKIIIGCGPASIHLLAGKYWFGVFPSWAPVCQSAKYRW